MIYNFIKNILFLYLIFLSSYVSAGAFVPVKNFLREKRCSGVLITREVKKYVCDSVELVLIDHSNFVLIGTKLIYSVPPVYCTGNECFVPEDVLEAMGSALEGKNISTETKGENGFFNFKARFYPVLFNFLPRSFFIRKVGANGGAVMIDPGHGGSDPGATGIMGTKEKDVVLTLSLALAKLLKKAGFKVYLTRDGDYFVSLEERSRTSMEKEPALFLSIHANYAHNSEAHGVEIYYAGFFSSDIQAEKVAGMENAGKKIDKNVLKILADLILLRQIELSSSYAHIFNYFLGRLPGVSTRGVRQGPFWILLSTGVPSVLIEVGFLSNESEERMLNNPSYQKLLVEGMFYAVVNSLQLSWRQ